MKNVDPRCKADLRHCDLDKFNAHRGQLAPKVCAGTVIDGLGIFNHYFSNRPNSEGTRPSLLPFILLTFLR